jgi:hypothetical protein
VVIFPFVSTLLLAGAAPPQPVDIRAVLVELTIDAARVTRACDTVESTGSTVIDAAACLLVTKMGVEIPDGVLPEKGGSPIKWKVRAAMVQFSDGASKLIIPPERMMRRVFLRTYPQGQRGAMLVEALDGKGGARSCAFFAPRTVSRFDSAKCERVVSMEEQATDFTVGENRRALIWTNAVVASGDL